MDSDLPHPMSLASAVQAATIFSLVPIFPLSFISLSSFTAYIHILPEVVVVLYIYIYIYVSFVLILLKRVSCKYFYHVCIFMEPGDSSKEVETHRVMMRVAGKGSVMSPTFHS